MWFSLYFYTCTKLNSNIGSQTIQDSVCMSLFLSSLRFLSATQHHGQQPLSPRFTLYTHSQPFTPKKPNRARHCTQSYNDTFHFCINSFTGRNRTLPNSAGSHRCRATRKHSPDGDSGFAGNLQATHLRGKDQELHHPFWFVP